MDESFVERCLRSLKANGRQIEYAIAGKEAGEPVLLFYPMGASRSFAGVFHGPARSAGLQLICVNRPGMGQASPVDVGLHIETHCRDVAACLDHLLVRQARLLFLCAGAPFALGFQARYPERSHGRLVGCSTWVSPRDCPWAKLMYQVGAGLPSAVIASLADAMMTWTRSMPSSSWSLSSLQSFGRLSRCQPGQPAEVKAVSVFEQKVYAETQAEVDSFMERCTSLLHMGQETGGEGADAATLVESARAWGVDYGRLDCSMVLLHGQSDGTVPVHCAEWLQNQIPKTVLHQIPDAEHGEAMLLGMSAALKLLIPRGTPPEVETERAPLEVLSV